MALLVGAGRLGRRGTRRSTPSRSAASTASTPAGDRVVTVDVEGVRVTPFVCYDLRFPEPFRLAAADTDLFAVVANWPEERREHWRTLLRARAIENLAYVAGVNRVGEGGGLRYAGDSAVDRRRWGETLVEGGGGGSGALRRRRSRGRRATPARSSRRSSDRRPEAYRR